MNPTTPQDDGGCAFPRTGFYAPVGSGVSVGGTVASLTTTTPADGMSLRDYFAAGALTALLTRSTFGPVGVSGPFRYEGRDLTPEELYAVVAYRTADAMIAERRTSADKRSEYATAKDNRSPPIPGTTCQ